MYEQQTGSHLVLSIPVCLSLSSVFQCLIVFRPICFYCSILFWKWFGNCRFHKHRFTEGLFLTAPQLISKLISKPKIRQKTGKSSLLPVKHRVWDFWNINIRCNNNKKNVLRFKSGLHTDSVLCSPMWACSLRNLSLHGKNKWFLCPMYVEILMKIILGF